VPLRGALVPPECFKTAYAGLAEGVGLVACGDLSNGSNCVLIPPECFKTAYGGLAEGVGFEPTDHSKSLMANGLHHPQRFTTLALSEFLIVIPILIPRNID
jgi:hypothetical protein